MKKVIGLSIFGILATSSQAMAANFAAIIYPPTLLNFVVLGVAVGCLVGSVKILGVLKGGQLFKSWQIFMFGFAALALGQTASLLNDFEILTMPGFVVPAVWVLATGLFFYGIYETKQTLD